MVHGTGGTIKALAGKTFNTSPETVHDDDDFCEATDSPPDQPVARRRFPSFLSRSFFQTKLTIIFCFADWYDSFKIMSLFSLGWYEAAGESSPTVRS